MSDIQALRPKVLQNLKVSIISGIDQQMTDITAQVARVDLFESIFAPYITVNMTIADTANLINEIPIVGQEVVQIYYQYKDQEIYKDFHVAEIKGAKVLTDTYGGYELVLKNHKEYLNSINTFSRSFSGRNTDIISQIHESYLGQEVEVLSDGGSSHNVVFPYVKPYSAIKGVVNRSFASDGTPLFLYETVNSETVKLQSLGDMLFEESALMLANETITNTNELGEGIRELPNRGPTATNQVIRNAYPTHRNIDRGYFASDVTTIDISNKTYSESVYTAKDNFEEQHIFHDTYYSDNYRLDERSFDQLNASKRLFYTQNGRAFNSSVGNLGQVDSITNATGRAYRGMLNNQTVRFDCDPTPDLEVGKMVDLTFKTMKPNLGNTSDDRDPVNSGSYLVTAIRHTIKGSKYTWTCEGMRSGINYEVTT